MALVSYVAANVNINNPCCASTLPILSVDSAATPVVAFPYIYIAAYMTLIASNKIYSSLRTCLFIGLIRFDIARYNLVFSIIFHFPSILSIDILYETHRTQKHQIHICISQIYFELLFFSIFIHLIVHYLLGGTHFYPESKRCLQRILYYAFMFNCVYNNNLSNILYD